ncbi:hypothetical protein [Candidatus Cryosericum terrychapinii]|uniref:Uncharacterized protein n=1 Tax=Candidatus Cryosericum terrychapinii TaxID=2290919 RepID=A0A398CVR6_9BACT|nr:hypothetical protein [Candidatus Cryosericum terrychapinii]RIE06802.1 hypothetical protein SMC7_00710 [Candidatus Cryosericum terrychapinii]
MSSVKTVAFQVCDIVKGTELRNGVFDVLKQLETASPPDNVATVPLSYMAQRRYKQFLGYLEVHFQRQVFMEAHTDIRIPGLSDGQLGALATAHKLLNWIVKNVASDVFRGRLDLASTVSPYYGADPNWWAAARPLDQSLRDAIRELAEAIVQDVPAKIVARSVADLPRTMFVGELDLIVRTINGVEMNIGKAGVDDAPSDLRDTVERGRKRDAEGLVTLFSFGELCLRAQIKTALQLLYQQFATSKLAALSEKNIIDVTYDGSTVVGPGLIVKAQASAEVMGVPAGDVIVVEHKDSRPHAFASVEAFNMSLDSQTGGVDTFNLRVLDDSLEPYSGLVASILRVQRRN